MRNYLMGICPGARETRWAVVLHDPDLSFMEFFGGGVVNAGDNAFQNAGYTNRVNAKVAEEINFAEGIGRAFRLGMARGPGFRQRALTAAVREVTVRLGVRCFSYTLSGNETIDYDDAGYAICASARVWAEPELQDDLKNLWKPTVLAVRAGLEIEEVS